MTPGQLHSPQIITTTRGDCWARRLLYSLGALCLVLLLLGIGVQPAAASGQEGDACFVSGSTGSLTLTEGESGPELTCVTGDSAAPITTPIGGACLSEDTRFYSVDGCVTNGQVCSLDDVDGTYQSGQCAAAAPTPSSPSIVTPPGGLTASNDLNIGTSAPPGADGARQSTLCVNASPFVGGGIGIVSGTVLCYTGDAAMTNVYAYQTSSGSLGVGPVSSTAVGGTWSGLTAQDFWATRNITAEGSIIAQGGAFLSGGDTQILSGSGQTGLQVTDAGVLVAAVGTGTAAGNDATVVVTPGNIVLTSTNPDETAQIGMTTVDGQMRIVQSVIHNDGALGALEINAGEVLGQAIDGNSFSRLQLLPEQAQTLSTDGTSTSFTQIIPDQILTQTTDGISTTTFVIDPAEAQLIAYDRALLHGGQTIGAGYSGTVTLGAYAGEGITTSGASIRGEYRNSPLNIGELTLGTAGAGAVLTGVASDPDGESIGTGIAGVSAGSGDALFLTGQATGSGTAVNIDGQAIDTGAPAIQLTGSLTGDTSVPSILIDGEASGSDSDSLRSRTGVLVTGSGNTSGSGTVSDAGVANWADVALMSRNFETGAPQGLGTAIIVNDYGVDIISAPLVAEQNDRSLNTFASGAGNTVGTTQVNVFGTGGPGTVINAIGHGGAEQTSVTVNTIGLGGGGVTDNTIGTAGVRGSVTNNTIGQGAAGPVNNAFGNASQTETGRVTNTIGMGGAANVSNTIGSAGQAGTQVVNSFGASGPGNVLNLIGTGTIGFSKNYFGNAHPRTNVNLEAGGSEINMRNGIVLTSLRPVAGLGNSVLPDATQQTSTLSGAVLRGASVEHATVDSTGRLLIQSGPVMQSTAVMSVVNGYGRTHGLVVNERQATLSGGTRASSSMTLDDSGARFGRAGDNSPIRVSGIADGQGAFDAVNIRQLHRAVAAAMATAPQVTPLPGQSGLGVGIGHYGSEQAIGLSFAHLSDRQVQFNLSAAHGGGRHTAIRTGMGFIW